MDANCSGKKRRLRTCAYLITMNLTRCYTPHPLYRFQSRHCHRHFRHNRDQGEENREQGTGNRDCPSHHRPRHNRDVPQIHSHPPIHH